MGNEMIAKEDGDEVEVICTFGIREHAVIKKGVIKHRSRTYFFYVDGKLYDKFIRSSIYEGCAYYANNQHEQCTFHLNLYGAYNSLYKTFLSCCIKEEDDYGEDTDNLNKYIGYCKKYAKLMESVKDEIV